MLWRGSWRNNEGPARWKSEAIWLEGDCCLSSPVVCGHLSPPVVTHSDDAQGLLWKIMATGDQCRLSARRFATNGALEVTGASIQIDRGPDQLNKQSMLCLLQCNVESHGVTGDLKTVVRRSLLVWTVHSCGPETKKSVSRYVW